MRYSESRRQRTREMVLVPPRPLGDVKHEESKRKRAGGLVEEYRPDSRNKVFVPWALLLASVAEETGRALPLQALSLALRAFGQMSSTDK